MKYTLEILDFAMTMEQEGKFFFTEWANRVKSAATKELFTELAKWEEEHIQFISKQRNALEKTGKILPIDTAVAAAEQKALQTFHDRGAAGVSVVTRNMSDLSALRLAITIEHDLHGFYGNAATKEQEPDLKELFTMLSKWEQNHLELLENQYNTLKQEFWGEMGFQPF
jgi:rubrerythrin